MTAIGSITVAGFRYGIFNQSTLALVFETGFEDYLSTIKSSLSDISKATQDLQQLMPETPLELLPAPSPPPFLVKTNVENCQVSLSDSDSDLLPPPEPMIEGEDSENIVF